MAVDKEHKKGWAQVFRKTIETIDQLKKTMFLMCWEEDPMMRRIHFNEAMTCLNRGIVGLMGEGKQDQLNGRPGGQTGNSKWWKLRPIENLYFNGTWHKDGEDDIYIFTDRVTGATFSILQGEDFISALAKQRAKFGKGFPDNEEMIYER